MQSENSLKFDIGFPPAHVNTVYIQNEQGRDRYAANQKSDKQIAIHMTGGS